MALKNAKLSEMLWYGCTAAIVYFGLTAYKPKYAYCFSKVQYL
jgi:hypothetical protein